MAKRLSEALLGESRFKNALLGTITGYFQYAILAVFQFALAPVVLRVSGQEVYGSYGVIMQILGMIALLDLGFSVSAGRFLAQAHQREQGWSRYFQIFRVVRMYCASVGVVGCLVCFGLSFFFNHWFSIKPAYQGEMRHALRLLAMWLAARSLIIPYTLGVLSLQWIAVSNLCGLLSGILRLGVSLVLVLKGWSITGLVLGNITAEAANLFIQRGIFVRQFKDVAEAARPPAADFKLFKQVFGFGLLVFLSQLSWQIGFQSGMVVTGILYGAWASSVYFSTYLPASTMYQVVLRFFDSFVPGLNQIWGSQNPGAIRHVALRMYKYGAAMMWPIPALIFLYGERIVTAWVGRAQFAGHSMLLAIAVFSLFLTVTRSSDIVLNVAGRIRVLNIIAVCDGFVNVGLAFFLGRRLGIAGVMWACVIAVFPRNVYLNVTALRILGLSMGEFARSFGLGFLLLGALCWAVIAAVAGRHFMWPSKYGVFAEVAVLYLAWLVVVVTGILERNDRSRLVQAVTSRFA
ncbi:MAG: hypothetical protein ABSH19_01240 [Opitutales bacterium]